jgi:histidyl-tRNA synthetase
MTPTLARMVAARQGSLTLPLKWYAIAQCFRYERMTRGRKREHYQWNLDVIGEPSVAAEAEVIACAVHALGLIGLQAGDYFVHFNSRALLADLLLKLGISAAHHPAVFLALDKRGKLDDAEIGALLRGAGLDDDATRRAFDLLAVTSLPQALALLGTRTRACDELERFLACAADHGINAVLRFDMSVIRGLSYYTGIVFEAFDAQRQFRAILGGGRYDNLMGDIGGQAATGVGLGFGDVVVAEILAAAGKTSDLAKTRSLAVGFMQDEQHGAAIRYATACRSVGTSVDLAMSPEKARHFFARVGKGGFTEAAYIGPDDVISGKLRVKNLLAHTEREDPLPTA